LIAGYYSVRVQACNENSGSNCSEPTTPVSVYLPKPAPGVPEWLPTDVSDEDHQARRFSVDWQKRSEDDFVDHYCLSSADGIRHTTGTSADFLNRIYGQTYNLQLQACSEAGDCSQPDTVLAGCSAWADTSVRLKFPTPEAPSGLAVQNLDAVEGNFTVVWDALNSWAPAYRYELEEQDGSGWKLLAAVEDPVHEHSVSDYEANIYRYHVRACNPDPDFDCGPWSSELQVSVTGNPVAIGYQYDVLGRLTKVLEDTAVKTGYCYDKAGNRNVVTAGGGGGDNCAGAQAPPFTMSGLHAALNPGNGYTVSWDAVPGADYYKIYLNKYDTSQPGEITVNPVVINAPATSYGTPSWFAPVWIEACDEFDVCDGRAYFNL
jgi:YD repeat-containing protein